MDPVAELSQPVFDALARGWTILTANQRAARTLRHTFDLRQQSLGLAQWTPPRILAWDSWLSALWHRLLLEGRESRLLLNNSQEHSLWRAIIADDSGTQSLRPVDSLAELAAAAWSRLHAWNAGYRLQSSASTTDTRAFARWAASFERRCLRSQLLTQAQLPQAIASALSPSAGLLPSGILLVGFDSLTPAQSSLLDSLRRSGVAIDQLAEPTPSIAQLVDATDPHTELLACAHWLRNQLAADPSAQLAVILPDIDADRAALDRVFRRVLTPHLDNIAAPASFPLYEFSLGIPLARTPIAATGLDLLAWSAAPLTLDRVSALLLSPYFAASEQDELLARAEFDAFTLRNRSFLEPQLTIDDLANHLARSRQSSGLPALRSHLQVFRSLLRRADLTRARSYAEWSILFQQLLDAAGWAPPSRLSSIEFQARSKWQDALDELAALDFDAQSAASRIPLRNALDALARIAEQSLFAPESRHAPIQILGPLESAGSSFDALWFLRAGDLAWPAPTSPSPLLPYPLQRELGMPGANPALDAAYACSVTHRIAASAPTVIFSYAQRLTDSHQRPSPALHDLALQSHSAASIAPLDPDPIPVPLDVLPDDTPIPSPPMPVRGGAAVLQSQAACAFRAFAERRLYSTALDSVSLGLDARERGSLIHDVLHDFWEEVISHAALLALPRVNRDALLARCIDGALARHHAQPGEGWSRAYIDAERRRLTTLLGAWLDYEATRSPFVVKSREELLSAVSIGPLQLDVRVDRVDELVSQNPEAPAEIILDYKTGPADPKDWLGPRPNAPQLPLYAVVSSAPSLAAVAFASIRPGQDMGLSGLQAELGTLPSPRRGSTGDLAPQREEWRATLESLAVEFYSGQALASPKSYPHTCTWCRQRLLCRLDLTQINPEDDLDEEIDTTSFSGVQP